MGNGRGASTGLAPLEGALSELAAQCGADVYLVSSLISQREDTRCRIDVEHETT
jgi:hypothetical protein